MSKDPVQMNVSGVRQLVGSSLNKEFFENDSEVSSNLEDAFELRMSDEELIKLSEQWKLKNSTYEAEISTRQERNKLYYQGLQRAGQTNTNVPIPDNLIFESEETFLPNAIAKNPEPVVWCDNTEEGKSLANAVKTMLQYHADILVLKEQLSRMARHWSVYFVGCLKHGWNEQIKDITIDTVIPKKLILDPDGYIDVYGNFVGGFLGEKKTVTAKKLIDMFPEHKAPITVIVDGKLGTKLTYIEWWTDEYCFYTLRNNLVLKKHKNPYFNYSSDEESYDEMGELVSQKTPGKNHFAIPKMPYTFLSVFSLGEKPHDETNLIEQNISNQERITERDFQIDKNLKRNNNAIAYSGTAFDTIEQAKQADNAMTDGGGVWVPNGGLGDAILRLPAPNIPDSVFAAQDRAKTDLRSQFGVFGLSTEAGLKERTVRGQILNQQNDTSRIGGSIGNKLEQVADNVFNWWVQLYYVFYDESHFASLLGRDRAVEYVELSNSNLDRKITISVSAGSMKPKDEISEMNLAVDRWNNKSIDPIELMKKLNEPDPMESARKLVLWLTNPQQYMAAYFPDIQPMMQPEVGVAEDQNIPPELEGTLSATPEAPSINMGSAYPQ